MPVTETAMTAPGMTPGDGEYNLVTAGASDAKSIKRTGGAEERLSSRSRATLLVPRGAEIQYVPTTTDSVALVGAGTSRCATTAGAVADRGELR